MPGNELITVKTIRATYSQLIDLIMRNNAFWYSIQGSTSSVDVDIEPVKIHSPTLDFKSENFTHIAESPLDW